MDDSPQTNPVVIEISVWFREHGEDKSCLLPQNLSDKILGKLISSEGLDSGDHSGAHGLLTAVGLMLADEEKKFGASREELAMAVKAYSFNLMLESLVRAGVITVGIPFSQENMFHIGFERNIALTDTGREAAKKAGNPLAKLLAGFTGAPDKTP